MKLALFFLASTVAVAAGWDAVQRISPDHEIEVRTQTHEPARGTFVSASETALLFRSKSGERSVPRTDIRQVRVADPSRRVRNGLLATGIGAGIGFAIGFAVCPQCSNEGAGAKYTGPLTAIGAGVGAIGFLPRPYRTVYKSQ